MKTVVVLGVDGLVLPLADHLADEGRLPQFARLRREGAIAPVLPFVSTWGPINWMCFATGASPGTAWPGTVAVSATGGGVYRAETLWEALARDGRSSLIISYPGAWPATTERAMVMVPDRAGTDLRPMELARPARYMTRGLAERYRQPPGTRVI
jgi:predicted AlkP superfamily phosphohydrolase/phosphomutase